MGLSLPYAAVALSVGLAGSAWAAETVDQTALTAVPIEVVNSGSAGILCEAEIAHWFAIELATIKPGGRATLDLRYHVPSGTWAAMNAVGEALPLERAWCGIEGRTYETRWPLNLPRQDPQPRQIDCRADADRLDCR